MLKIARQMFALAVVLTSGTAFGQATDLAELLIGADANQFAEIFPNVEKFGEQALPIFIKEIDQKLALGTTDDAKENLAKRQVNAAVALLKLGQAEKVWPLLRHSPDPRVRCYLIHRLAPLGADPKTIIKRLDVETDITIRRALLLSLGAFAEAALSLDDRKALLPKLQEMYRTEADPGLHSAVEWLLRTWKQQDWLNQIIEQWASDNAQREKRLQDIQQLLSKDKEKASPQWYVNSQGQSLVAMPKPGEFWVGEKRERHRSRIEYNFLIASKEVTVKQFVRFLKETQYAMDYAPTADCPVNNVTWYEAAEYCNWLSEQEGISKDQWCYEPNKDGKFQTGMTIAADFLQRSGYRLPTEIEWEYACRAGSDTKYSCGESDELASNYGWSSGNSSGTSHPVGSLKGNDLGLFDLHGNSWEWSQDAFREGTKTKKEQELLVKDQGYRMLRGGSFLLPSSGTRSAIRTYDQPIQRKNTFGFRFVRTLRSDSH